MKTLIWKELRENLILGTSAFLLASVLVIGTQLYYLDLIKSLAQGANGAQNYDFRLQPLVSSNFRVFCMLVCCLAGVALGWFQISVERHRDLWAFLVHRPVTRTMVFWSKVLAGLMLYGAAMGLPLGYFLWWVIAPGHVAAPFEWPMAVYLGVAFLTGVGWYFAGMLMSIRQTRWLGSRPLAMGAPVLAMFAMFQGISFAWIGILAIVSLGAAVWGAVQTGGNFRRQPVAGKIGLTFSLTAGCWLIVMAATFAVMLLEANFFERPRWSYYTMGKDGNMYEVLAGDQKSDVLNLNGKPVNDPETGKPIDREKFNRNFASAGVGASTERPQNLHLIEDHFRIVAQSRDFLWYWIKRTGRVEGYDKHTRRLVGSLGPDGWATNRIGGGTGFIQESGIQDNLINPGISTLIMTSKNGLFILDLETRTVKPIWTIQTDEILGSGIFSYRGGVLLLTKHDAWYFHIDKNSAAVIWHLQLLRPPRKLLAVSVYELNFGADAAYCVWEDETHLTGQAPAPTKASWVDIGGTITKEMDVPKLAPPTKHLETLQEVVQPAAVYLTTPEVEQHRVWRKAAPSLLLGIPGVLLGLWLGGRYHFSAKRQFIWALFNLLFGAPGFLGFLAVQEWPARERCPSCGKLRVVEEEKCEHCGAGFDAPKRNGTEIFEVLEMT